jgi:hypothetical protein
MMMMMRMLVMAPVSHPGGVGRWQETAENKRH